MHLLWEQGVGGSNPSTPTNLAIDMSGQWHGGKGSSRRKSNITKEEYDKRWDAIFGSKTKKDENLKNEYQDILSTEDCVLNSFDK